MFKVPERYRVRDVRLAVDGYGNNGAFVVPFESFDLRVIASDGAEWEHVSVSLPNRIPNWREMCLIKELFWGDEDTVVQFHPPKADYVNLHPNCLHLWRHPETNWDLPPLWMV